MSLKQKATRCYAYVPDTQYIPAGTLPFRSRNGNQQQSKPQHVKWQDMHLQQQQTSSKSGRFDSSSPTSVIEQARGDNYPSTPSPICSPSPSSATSPRHSTSSKTLNSSELLLDGLQNDPAGASSNKSEEKAAVSSGGGGGGPSESAGNSFACSTEGGLLALLASKLFSYRESRVLQHSGEKSEASVHDKHVTEDDRGSKPPVEEILADESPLERLISHHNVHRRTSSDTPSEISIGSANERTLSMEFDAVLAAAVAAGIGQATATRNVPGESTADMAGSSEYRLQLPGIEENRSFRGSYSEDRDQLGDEIDNAEMAYALVPMTMAADSVPEETSTALTLVGQVTASEERSLNRRSRTEFESEIVPQSPRSSSRGSRRSEPDGEMVRRSRIEAEVGSGHEGRRMELLGESLRLSPQSSYGSSQEPRSSTNERTAEGTVGSFQVPSLNNNEQIVSSHSRQLALQKVRREKIFAKALAFQEAKNARCENRYKREEVKILTWENQQRIKASISMKKVEMKLEERRARAYEKMQNEIALAHKKAEERKATAEARRGAKAAKVADEAERIKRTGKIPGRCIFF